MSIEMDEKTSFTFSITGNEAYHTAMLGAVRFCEDWLIRAMRKKHLKGEHLCGENEGDTLEEIEVSKEGAIEAYWKALEKIKERLLSIDKAAPDATFTIDPQILSDL